MKKLMKRWMALGLCAALCAALAACGSTIDLPKTEAPDTSFSAPAKSDVSAAPAADAASPAGVSQSGGDTDNLETFINQNKTIIDRTVASMAIEGMNIEVIAEDNTLIYNYTYEEDMFELTGTDLDALVVYLDTAMETAEPTFNGLLNTLKTEVPSAESIVVNYRSPDGSLIYSREFDGTGQSGESGLEFVDGFDSLESFVAMNQNALDQSMASMATDDWDIEITAQGNSLIYNFVFKIDLGTDMEAVQEYLDSAMDGLGSTFTYLLSSLKAAVPSTESIVVNFYDRSGGLIFSKEYK